MVNKKNEKKSSSRVWVILLILLIAGAAAYLLYDNLRTKTEMQEMVEQMNFEKEQLEDEYKDLALQFDGYGGDIQNDSLAELLSKEQQRVQDLLEELRITKATNAKRIAELKKELATVRSVMVQYVQQIDSLSQTNKRLTAENIQVKEQYEQVSQKATRLEEETSRLNEVVNRASMLEIINPEVVTLNNRDKKTNSLNKIKKIQFNFTIGKNITTEVGKKIVYLRLLRPDGEVMLKSQNNLFDFEGSSIEYSIKKEFEYAGENISETMYWDVEEILQVGVYNADFFIDGNLCGSFPFSLKK